MKSYFIWLSPQCPISLCFLTVGKSRIAELWKGGRLKEQNKVVFLELCRCVKAERQQKQDLVKLHLHWIRSVSKGAKSDWRRMGFFCPAGPSWICERCHCTDTASKMGHATENFVVFSTYNQCNHFNLKSAGVVVTYKKKRYIILFFFLNSDHKGICAVLYVQSTLAAGSQLHSCFSWGFLEILSFRHN